MGAHPRNAFFAAAIALVAACILLQPVTSYADETADINRILELNDAYAEASRAWRAKEITRAEMQERHKSIQAESRTIHARYGRAGSAERRAWDRKVRDAKRAYAKQKERDARAARAEVVAEEKAARQAEREAAAAALAEELEARLQRDARRTAELRVQMQEDLIDSQIGWMPYGSRDQSVIDRHKALMQSWSGSDQSGRFHALVLDHFIDLLEQRSAMSTAERRAPLAAENESAVAMAAERDAAAWVAQQPRAAEVIAAYPGDDPQSAARRSAALNLVQQGFSMLPGWNKETLKGTLHKTEFQQAIFELDQGFAAGSSERSAYDQAKTALRYDPAFVREVAEAFQPQEVARQDNAAEWQRIRAESSATGRTVAIATSALLSIAVIVWGLISMLQTRRGGFEATEVDDRLEFAYQRNKHGVLAFAAAALVWGLLVVILVVFIMPEEEPQFLKNAVLRDPANAGTIAFGLYFLIFGVPAAGLLLLNLLRLGTKRFSITPTAVVVGNKTYQLTQEQCYFVEAPDTGPETVLTQQSGGTFFIGSGPAVAGALAGAAVARGMRSGQQAAHGIGRLLALAVARIRYSIGFNHHGGSGVLARGLSQRRANAMLERIGQFVHAERLQPEP